MRKLLGLVLIYGFSYLTKTHINVHETLIKTVSTKDGIIQVYKTDFNCNIYLNHVYMQTVELTVCNS